MKYTYVLPDIKREKEKKKEADSQWTVFGKHLLAGGLAGAFSRTVTAPLDRLRTFMMMSKKQVQMKDIMRDMMKEGGVTSLWRGNFINVLKTTPKMALRFAFYEETKKKIKGSDKRQLTNNERFFAASFSGLACQTIMYPTEMLKTRLTLRKSDQYRGILHATVHIYRREGIRSFVRGYVASFLSVIPYSAIDLAGYEYTKLLLKKKFQRDPNLFDKFIIGGLSCLVAQICTYPLALVCTRMQAKGVYATKMRREFVEIVVKEGWSGLYRGCLANIIKYIPVVGFTFVAYEKCLEMLSTKMSV